MRSATFESVTGLLLVILVPAFETGCGQTSESQNTGARVISTKCGMEMVPIASGQFTMGENDGAIDAKPAHLVKLEGFLMDQHEITQEVYEKITGKNPSRRKAPRNPVEQVTWSSAVVFCNARSSQEGLQPCYNTNTWECDFSVDGYRLPTEAEWEYA